MVILRSQNKITDFFDDFRPGHVPLIKVSKNYRLQISRPGEGGGVGRVFILDFHVNVASNMWNLGFKGLLHILTL